jgi:hypothetical protein
MPTALRDEWREQQQALQQKEYQQSQPKSATQALAAPTASGETTGVFNPASDAAALGAVNRGAGGLNYTTRNAPIGLGDTTVPIVTAQSPVTREDMTAASLADYNAQMQAAAYNQANAQKALATIQQATTDTMAGLQGKVDASRTRLDKNKQGDKDALAADTERVRQAYQDNVNQAKTRETQGLDDTIQRWTDLMNNFKDTSAAKAQSLVIGARQAFKSKQQALQSLAASGAPGYTPESLQIAQKELEAGYASSVGQAIATAAVDFNNTKASLTSLATQHIASLRTAFGAQTNQAFGERAAGEFNIAQLNQNARQIAEQQSAASELQLVQLESQSELLRLRGAEAEASLLTSDAMKAYAGALSPLVTSLYNMYAADNNTVVSGALAGVPSGGDAASMFRITAGSGSSNAYPTIQAKKKAATPTNTDSYSSNAQNGYMNANS